METGEAAETWLDERLAADDRWDDGVPDDAAPWVAAAFADVATLSIEELTAAADEVAVVDHVADETDLGADVAAGVGLDDWLGNHPAFEPAGDDVGFTIDQNDLDQNDLDADAGSLDDPAVALGASASVSADSTTGLLDPFDDPIERTVAAGIERSADVDLSDDIVTAPVAAAAPADGSSDEPLVVASDDPATALPDIAVTESGVFNAAAGLDVADAGLLDGSLVADPFDGHDVGHDIDAGDAASADPTDDAGEDLLDEFGDDGWADD